MQIQKVLTRIFLNPADLNATIAFYERLCGEQCQIRFKYQEKGLELAGVGPFLLIAGSENSLTPFKDTPVTLRVDSIAEFKAFLQQQGATILEEPKAVPTGQNMRVKHPDGLLVEYVEFVRRG
jgi:catechol 2,3-dioxygenase-like lactoylglutathione lyase family enzyme